MAGSYSYHNPNKSKLGPEQDSGCCTLSCLKFGLYIYNLSSLLSGLAVLAISLWIVIDRDQNLSAFSNTYTVLAWVGLGLGSFILVTTIIGCCGISRESHLLMYSYAVLCGILILVEVAGGVTSYVYRQTVHQELVVSLNSSIVQEYGNVNSTTAAIDSLQIGLQCCGAASFEDWSRSEWIQSDARGHNKVPDSCCKSVSRFCGVRDHPSNIYYTGCGETLAILAARHLLLLGTMATAIALLQILGLVLSCKVGRTMKELED